MATLEVHDGKGRVQFVELSRDHPVLFGTSSACDVILQGEFIRPVHGRIRWKEPKFKVEASPDAEFVLINGHKMTTGSLRQGDEITVGDCRMFLDPRVATKRGRSAAGRAKIGVPETTEPELRQPYRWWRGARSNPGRAGQGSGERDEPPLLERKTTGCDSPFVQHAGIEPVVEPGIASVEAPLRRSLAGHHRHW